MTEDQVKLVTDYRWFAWKLAKRYHGPRSPHSLDELRAAAEDGLMAAARRFDPSRGFKFTTFAGFQIRAAVRRFRFMNSSVVRRPERATRRAGTWVEHDDAMFDEPPAATTWEPEAWLDQKAAALRATYALDTRERRVLVENVVYEQPLQAISEELYVSRERARQLRARALKKARAATWIDDETLDVERTVAERAAAQLEAAIQRRLDSRPVTTRALAAELCAPMAIVGRVLMAMEDAGRAKFTPVKGWTRHR